MYSLLSGGGLYRMSFQTLKDLSTNQLYRAPVKRHLALLIVGLVAVLVLAGQLARAAAGPGPDDPQDSLPAWSSSGRPRASQLASSTWPRAEDRSTSSRTGPCAAGCPAPSTSSSRSTASTP